MEDCCNIGQRVKLGELEGVVRYHGPVHFSSGLFVGVELDRPYGKNDGSVDGKRYFRCTRMHGMFIRPTRLVPVRTSGISGSTTGPRMRPPVRSTAAPMRPSSRPNVAPLSRPSSRPPARRPPSAGRRLPALAPQRSLHRSRSDVTRAGGLGNVDPIAQDVGVVAQASTFEESFICYPVSFCGRGDEDVHGKMLLPASVLGALTGHGREDLGAEPVIFAVSNPQIPGRTVCCSVLEFVAEEHTAYLPFWRMEHLFVEEGGAIQVRRVCLPKGTYVKLQPQSSDFLQISNPKAVLERTLRKVAALTAGETVRVFYNGRVYDLVVVETLPATPSVSIFQTDLNVDFAPPLDHPSPPQAPPSVRGASSSLPSIPASSKLEKDRKSENGPHPEEVSVTSGVASALPDIAPGASNLKIGGARKHDCDDDGANEGESSTGSISGEESSSDGAAPFRAFTGKGYTLAGEVVDDGITLGEWKQTTTREVLDDGENGVKSNGNDSVSERVPLEVTSKNGVKNAPAARSPKQDSLEERRRKLAAAFG